MSKENKVVKTLDVRNLPPGHRHTLIFEEFSKIKPGEIIEVINDHEPVHLFHFLSHVEDFDAESYNPVEVEPGKWSVLLKKKLVSISKTLITNIDENRKYSDKAFNPVQVYAGQNYAVIFAYFKAGQFIPVHSPSIDVIIFVYKGKGKVFIGEKITEIKEGDLVVVPKWTKRGILAETDMELLHIVTPKPSLKDHEEVQKGLDRGSWLP